MNVTVTWNANPKPLFQRMVEARQTEARLRAEQAEKRSAFAWGNR